MGDERAQAIADRLTDEVKKKIIAALRSGANWKLTISGNQDATDFAARTEYSNTDKIKIATTK